MKNKQDHAGGSDPIFISQLYSALGQRLAINIEQKTGQIFPAHYRTACGYEKLWLLYSSSYPEYLQDIFRDLSNPEIPTNPTQDQN